MERGSLRRKLVLNTGTYVGSVVWFSLTMGSFLYLTLIGKEMIEAFLMTLGVMAVLAVAAMLYLIMIYEPLVRKPIRRKLKSRSRSRRAHQLWREHIAQNKARWLEERSNIIS